MADIRLLKASEIECRVQSVKKNGCVLLLYKDARCDMKILDETFGILGWEREHQLVNGNLFCTVRVYDADKKIWISKQDVGTESNTEKEKGQASDSFKRACFNFGIGRELYTSPFIWISLNSNEIIENKGKVQLNPKVHFKVKSIDYNQEREISKLEIVDQSGATRYKLGTKISTNIDKPKVSIPLDKKPTTKPNSNTYKCATCNKPVSEKVASYSKGKFGKVLCMDHQKSEERY
ncbi:hypothetical protein KYB31_09365 [Clostridium felsineum]|uniref:hypothetical protein n=1 Tax=Clostridium felsineum TaxID=36839 RepID=UPI00214D1FEB|nr:hypothetical protein [Clostridium felsineum]MCR3759197.1 hypothetical protein [Clostridium felsineum]